MALRFAIQESLLNQCVGIRPRNFNCELMKMNGNQLKTLNQGCAQAGGGRPQPVVVPVYSDGGNWGAACLGLVFAIFADLVIEGCFVQSHSFLEVLCSMCPNVTAAWRAAR
jgi:hypothetical protein